MSVLRVNLSRTYLLIILTMNIFIVDFQGFGVFNKDFILKELAILNNGYHHHFIVTPPCNLSVLPLSLKKQAYWLYNNYHSLSWNGGSINFTEVKTSLRNNIRNGTVYVKGVEKAQWLREILNNENVEVKNVEDFFSCPNLKELKRIYPDQIKCQSHAKCCALQNVYLLSKFLMNEKHCIPL